MHAVDVNEGERLKSLDCETSHLDVTSPHSIKQFKERFGNRPLDVLLNVAGMPYSSPFPLPRLSLRGG